MDNQEASKGSAPNIDYSLKNELDRSTRSRLDDQQIDMFFSRLLKARSHVDQLFHEKYGLPAYPYLDILLFGRNVGDKFEVEHICENLLLAPSLAKRHLAIMLSIDLLERNGSAYQLSISGKHVLIDIVENNLSNAFRVVD